MVEESGEFAIKKRLEDLKLKIEADPNIKEKLFSLDSPEEVQSFLEDKGISFSINEINEIRDIILKIVTKKENGELSEEDLEEVAGGFVALTATIIGLLAGVVAGGLVGANATHNATRGRW